MAFEANAFAPLANIDLQSPCRLLASACCPDKDLVVLITRLGGLDRLSLWKIQGPKKWEVDVCTSETTSEQIVGVTWSPDGKFPMRISILFFFANTFTGQIIGVAHDPPSITLHSVQDGHEEHCLPISTLPGYVYHFTSVWWFHQEKVVATKSIPDIFKRNDVIVSHLTQCVRYPFDACIDRHNALYSQNVTSAG